MPTQTDTDTPTTDNIPPRDNDKLTWRIEHRKRPRTEGGHWHTGILTASAEIDGKQRIVGQWEEHTTDRGRNEAKLREIEARMKDCRLYIIHVDQWAIDAGESRSCSTCAIAQALWKWQKGLDIDTHVFTFEVSPYAAWAEGRGILYHQQAYGDGEAKLAVSKLPNVVNYYRSEGEDRHYDEPLEEWAQTFDDWSEYQPMSATERKEWRDQHDGAPAKPCPMFFLLNADDFVIETPFDYWGRPMPSLFPEKPKADDDE